MATTKQKKTPPRHKKPKVDELAEAILETLREQGFRITNVRRAMISIFSNAEQPLSAPDISKALSKQRLQVNKTTVYRELEFLLQNNLIAEIDLLDGMKRYELAQHGHGHHHHLVCTKCNAIQCVEMENDLDAIERAISRSHNFTVTSHVLEFFGLCRQCA